MTSITTIDATNVSHIVVLNLARGLQAIVDWQNRHGGQHAVLRGQAWLITDDHVRALSIENGIPVVKPAPLDLCGVSLFAKEDAEKVIEQVKHDPGLSGLNLRVIHDTDYQEENRIKFSDVIATVIEQSMDFNGTVDALVDAGYDVISNPAIERAMKAKVDKVLGWIVNSDAFDIGGPLLTEIGIFGAMGTPDNEVARIAWVDDSEEYAIHLTEEGIAWGRFIGGAFECEDSEGDPVKINAYTLTPKPLPKGQYDQAPSLKIGVDSPEKVS